MSEALENLPDDVETLRAMLLAERARIATLEDRTAQAQASTAEVMAEIARLEMLKAENTRLEAEVERLTALSERYEHIIAQLNRLQFGKRSEQMDKDERQLAFEDLMQGLAEGASRPPTPREATVAAGSSARS